MWNASVLCGYMHVSFLSEVELYSELRQNACFGCTGDDCAYAFNIRQMALRTSYDLGLLILFQPPSKRDFVLADIQLLQIDSRRGCTYCMHRGINVQTINRCGFSAKSGSL